MKATRWSVVLICGLASLLALPAAANAKPGYTVKSKSLHLTLALPTSDGYSASLETNGHRQVVLTLAKGGFKARYTALGRVTRKRIEADFDSLGRVSLRFRGKRRYKPTDPLSFLYDRCRGRPSVGELGMFVGAVRFDGERGYARIHAHRAAGKAVRSYRQVCRNAFRATASSTEQNEENLYLSVQGRSGGVLHFLIGVRLQILGLTIAVGGEQRKLGRVAIVKSRGAIDYPGAIRISPSGRTPVIGKVKLAKPFEGSASYLKDGNAPPVWNGSLQIRLPGSGLVPLTGPEFSATLCRASTEAELRRCNKLLLEALPFRYGSGSGSQSPPPALARLSSLAAQDAPLP